MSTISHAVGKEVEERTFSLDTSKLGRLIVFFFVERGLLPACRYGGRDVVVRMAMYAGCISDSPEVFLQNCLGQQG